MRSDKIAVQPSANIHFDGTFNGFALFTFATAGIVVLPPAPRFKDNIFSTFGVGGGLCKLVLLRLG